MSVWNKYKDYYSSLDGFIEDLIDTYLWSDSEYREKLLKGFLDRLRRSEAKTIIVRSVDLM